MIIYSKRNLWSFDRNLIRILGKGVEEKITSTPLPIFLPISKIENRQNLGKSSLSAWLCHFHLTLNYRK